MLLIRIIKFFISNGLLSLLIFSSLFFYYIYHSNLYAASSYSEYIVCEDSNKNLFKFIKECPSNFKKKTFFWGDGSDIKPYSTYCKSENRVYRQVGNICPRNHTTASFEDYQNVNYKKLTVSHELDNLQKKIIELQKFVYDKEVIIYADLPFQVPELQRELIIINSKYCMNNDNTYCEEIPRLENDLLDINKFIENNIEYNKYYSETYFIVEGLSFPNFQKEDFLYSSSEAKYKISDLYALFFSDNINSLKKKEGFLRSLESADESLSRVFDKSKTHYDLMDDISNLFQLYATLDEFKVESKIVNNSGISFDSLEGTDLPKIPKQTIDDQKLITDLDNLIVKNEVTSNYQQLDEQQLSRFNDLNEKIINLQKIVYENDFEIKKLPYFPENLRFSFNFIEFQSIKNGDIEKERILFDIVELEKFIYQHPSYDNAKLKIVNASPLNVRDKPNGEWLSILNKDEEIIEIDKTKSSLDGTLWSKIVDQNGFVGWVSSKYLQDDDSFSPEPLIVEDNNPTKQKQITIVSNEIDNDNPSINCNDYSIFTEERSVNVKCNIQDNDEILKVFVNGNEVEYISELIDVDVNLRYGSQIIQVQAIDVSGNESLVQIEANREFILAEEKKVIEPLNPGLINVPKNNKRIALVIGIKDYKDIDDTKYADTDAQTFIDYAIDTLGIEIGNIKYFINDEAGFLDFATIDRWMNSKIKEDTEVFVFYSGHGANYKGEPLLLPADFRPDLIENSSYNKQDFLEKISSYKPKHIFAFFDACFSGLGREGETLIAGLRNISIVEEEVPFSGITIFNSSSGAEFSRDFDDAGHGLFSYYLMKGLEGKADLNKDKSITTKELHNFISMNVSEQSLNLGIPQNPSLVSNDNRVIVKW